VTCHDRGSAAARSHRPSFAPTPAYARVRTTRRSTARASTTPSASGRASSATCSPAGRELRTGELDSARWVSRRHPQRQRALPRPPPRRPPPPQGRPRLGGRTPRPPRPARDPHPHLRTIAPRGRPPRRRPHHTRRRQRRPRHASTWAWSPRPSSPCWPAPASAPSTPSCSAASRPRPCTAASSTVQARVVITQDGAWRRGHVVPMKPVVDAAIALGSAGRQGHRPAPHRLSRAHARRAATCGGTTPSRSPPHPRRRAAAVDAEHPLFILYTSGSTGKPKGVLHSSAGYLAGAYLSAKYVFDLRPEDLYWCTADIGWITGHSYLVYGPLANGASILIYEGAPNAPDPGRLWQIVERHRVTILYTAPTAIRSFMRWGDEWPAAHDLTSLRLLGTVGEPIGPDAWHWYHRTIGGGRCPIVDTWWQTETGSIMLTTLPGAVAARPGRAGLPLFGVDAAVVHADGSPCAPDENGLLVLRRAWPSMLRTIWGDHDRFHRRRTSPDPRRLLHRRQRPHRRRRLCHRARPRRRRPERRRPPHRHRRDRGRRRHPPRRRRGRRRRPPRRAQGPGPGRLRHPQARPRRLPGPPAEILGCVAHEVGKFARPDELRFTEALPKTRSGKIMRRFLKEIAAGRDHHRRHQHPRGPRRARPPQRRPRGMTFIRARAPRAPAGPPHCPGAPPATRRSGREPPAWPPSCAR
jgi:acyl-coenzyme A synthetase/AMP-(fatty) acid ligase